MKFKISTFFAMVLFTINSMNAQNNLGAACGCPAVSARTTSVNISTLADANGDLTANNTILTCDKLWVLDKKIYVDSLKSLTIQPGTVIKATFGSGALAPALIVSRGAKIIAAGQESCPIVFTSASDNMNGTYDVAEKGQWGGVIVLGFAGNNLMNPESGTLAVADGVGFIEGFTSADPRILYGAAPGSENNDDNSGILTYVSIRHGGAVVGTANEINGLTLGSVGRGTTIHHIEIMSNLDDGIELFGGTVDLKYCSILFSDDDGFDWDHGWNGRIQFGVVVKTDIGTATSTDNNGFELDADDSDDAFYLVSPKMYNCTFIGGKGINGNNASDVSRAINWKEGARGEIRNCVFSNFETGVQFATETTHKVNLVASDDTYAAWVAGQLVLENNTFIGTTTAVKRDGATVGDAGDLTRFTTAGNVAVASIPGYNGVHVLNTATGVVSTKHDIIPNPGLSTTSTPPQDGFFTPANYRGAFESGKKSWLSDYSLNALIQLEANLLPCPADITGDGVISAADFNALIGVFGSSCN